MTQETKRIGVLTSGGDCSGLNTAIRAVVFSAITRGWEVYGIHNATDGLIARPLDYRKLTMADFEFPFAALGGTMLGTNNSGNPYRVTRSDGMVQEITEDELLPRFKDGVEQLGLSALVVIGGDGSMAIVSKYCKAAGISMIGIPKTIDNDAPGTELAIGFATARSVVTDALDKLDTTASSHHRVMIAEVMGRGAGHLALESAIAGFADVALIPEIPYTYEHVVDRLKASFAAGKKHALVVIAEGIKKPDGQLSYATNGRTFGGVSAYFAEQLGKDGFNVRANVLGHIQRAGQPIAEDRILASAFAVHAVDLLAAGQNNRVVVYRNGRVSDEDLDAILNLANSPVDPNGPMVQTARSLGIYVGEK
ncbi:MAG: ATP-dependent 6-phosphofructokinase [Alphaproteobacteria bacterium]|nr:ATP-dependent 6-phosphofructokinase [Alphaproteobacteria bacterium]